MLGRPALGQLLRTLADQYDVILIDTPAGSDSSDAQMVAGRTGAAVVVARQDVTHVGKVHDLVASLNEARVHVVGSVLNNF